MDEVARLAPSDRADLFRAAAETLGYSPAIVEKDFWVCWTLRRVFALPDPPADILFKGGTSLSKAFGVLDRFSEDIDLVLDRHGLGFTAERDPASPELSRKKRQSLIKELQHACQTAVWDALLPRRRTGFETGQNSWLSPCLRASPKDQPGTELRQPTAGWRYPHYRDARCPGVQKSQQGATSASASVISDWLSISMRRAATRTR